MAPTAAAPVSPISPTTRFDGHVIISASKRAGSVPDLAALLRFTSFTKDGGAAALEHLEGLALLSRKPSYRAAIMAAGADATLAALVAALNADANNSHASREAAATLQNLAIDNCSAVLAAGSLQPLLRLVLSTPADADSEDAEPGSESLLAAAVGAVSNLADDDGACTEIASEPGCVDRLVTLLTHPSCVVREAAASVLAKLAWLPELCGPITAAGAVKPLLGLLSADTSDNGGRQVAAAALENLTYESASIRRSVAEQGAIPLLVDVLSSGCCAAQKSAAGALHNLAINSSLNCDKIAAAGGIEPLVEMLETAPSTELQAAAGGTLGKLATQDPAYRVEMVEAREKIMEEAENSN